MQVRRQIKDTKVFDHFVNIWKVLYLIIYHQGSDLGRHLAHDLDNYVGRMERTVSNAAAMGDDPSDNCLDRKKLIKVNSNVLLAPLIKKLKRGPP